MSINLRVQSTQEEIINSILHGVGVLIALVGMILLVNKAFILANTRYLFSTIILCLSFVILFLMSVLHHSLVPNKAKHIFLVLDYAAIYLVIATTYSAFVLSGIELTIWTGMLLIVIWSASITGITLSAIFSKKIKQIAPWFYIGLGWLGILIVQPLIAQGNAVSALFLILGGGLYTMGTYFYLNDSKKYFHAIWHLFVLIAAISHISALYILK